MCVCHQNQDCDLFIGQNNMDRSFYLLQPNTTAHTFYGSHHRFHKAHSQSHLCSQIPINATHSVTVTPVCISLLIRFWPFLPEAHLCTPENGQRTSTRPMPLSVAGYILKQKDLSDESFFDGSWFWGARRVVNQLVMVPYRRTNHCCVPAFHRGLGPNRDPDHNWISGRSSRPTQWVNRTYWVPTYPAPPQSKRFSNFERMLTSISKIRSGSSVSSPAVSESPL
jgi:hypothetical protein